MLRMLIVDDMPIIVDDLADMFRERGDLELEILKAYDPNEALRILNDQSIDIVLSDIKMPGMDGIELLKHIRTHWPRCKVIFLTSHHDFQFAKAAISLGSFDFILKTEGDQKIFETVEKAVHSIREEWKLKDLIEMSSQRYIQAKPFLQREVLMNLLFGARISEMERAKQFQNVDLPLSPSAPVYVLLSRIDAWKDPLDFNSRQLMNFSVQNIFEEYVSGKINVFSFSYDRSNLVWLLQPNHADELPEKEWIRLFRFIYGTVETVQYTCKEKLKLKLSFMVGSKAVPWDRLAEAFHQLDATFHSGMALNEEILAVDDDQEQETEHSEAIIPAQLLPAIIRFRHNDIRHMAELLKAGNQTEFVTMLDSFFKLIQQHRTLSLRIEVYHMLSSLLMSCINSRDVPRSFRESIDLQKLCYFDPHAVPGSYEAFFRGAFAKWFEYKSNDLHESNHKVVLKLHEYIRTNLHGDLSLTRLGEHVQLNPSYLSRWYKQMTGISLTDYITDRRIQVAKELLRENMKIQDIAEAVGYFSGTAFTRFFKKHLNMTPQEYRDALS